MEKDNKKDKGEKNIKKSLKKAAKNKQKEEVCEVFTVEENRKKGKDGKREDIRICNSVEVVEDSSKKKKQVEKENKQLRNILIIAGLIIVLFLGGYIFFNSLKFFEYKGVQFETVKYCDVKPCLVVHKTSFPVIYNGAPATYDIYLRNDPRKLNDVVFQGNIELKENMVVNMTEDFNCEGDGMIAIANLVKSFEVLGTRVLCRPKCNL